MTLIRVHANVEGDPVSGTFILKPYERRREPGIIKRALIGIGLVLLAAFYGVMCSILPFQLIIIPAVPIIVMLGVILWMLPDVGGMPYDRLKSLVLLYLAVNILWPNYVAINFPGLPWITPTRAIIGVILVILLYSVATSSEMRRAIADSLDAFPWVRRIFWIFWVTTTFSLIFSARMSTSLLKYVNNQIYWTMFLGLSAFLATRPGFVKSAARILAWSMIIVAIVGLVEFGVGRVIWLDHLPQFLKADQELLAIAGDSQARAGTNIYRVRGTFVASLYFAEYTAMAFPFVFHAMCRAKSFRSFTALFAGLFACMATMFLTNARSAMIGMLMTFVLYGFFAAWRFRSQNKTSLFSTAVVVGYPAAMGTLMIIVLAWNRLKVAVIGGGQNAASDDARATQWAMGMPKVLTHPFGHGSGESAGVLGYANPAGELTIDSYYLSLLLDYGFLGFTFFILLFLVAILFGGFTFVRSRTEEELIAAPLTISLVNFLVIKSVLSSEANMPVAFILLGCLIGLVWQMRRARGSASDGSASASVEDNAGTAGLPAPA